MCEVKRSGGGQSRVESSAPLASQCPSRWTASAVMGACGDLLSGARITSTSCVGYGCSCSGESGSSGSSCSELSRRTCASEHVNVHSSAPHFTQLISYGPMYECTFTAQKSFHYLLYSRSGNAARTDTAPRTVQYK